MIQTEIRVQILLSQHPDRGVDVTAVPVTNEYNDMVGLDVDSFDKTTASGIFLTRSEALALAGALQVVTNSLEPEQADNADAMNADNAHIPPTRRLALEHNSNSHPQPPTELSH